jgi:hypothetical protein
VQDGEAGIQKLVEIGSHYLEYQVRLQSHMKYCQYGS